MNTSLQHRMRNRRKTAGKRGFSSVVGAVFMVLIMSVLASSYFVYTFSENNLYNNTVAQKNQLDQTKMSESLQVRNTTYTTYNNTNNININSGIQNIGSTSVQFVTVWICVTNSTPWTAYNFSSLTNANVQPGNVYALNIDLTVSGLISGSNSTYSYNYASWLVTSNGNTVALAQRIVSSNVIISAQVAQGIGSISMDFKAFKYYDFGSGSFSNGTVLPSPTISYTISASHNTILSLQLTNFDNSTSDITLYSQSNVWIAYTQAGSMKSAWWNIANVTNDRYISSFSTLTLHYATPVTVYFGPGPQIGGGSGPSGVVPVFILLYGKIASNDFGQNIPFVAFYMI